MGNENENGTGKEGEQGTEDASVLRTQLGELGGANKLLEKQLAFAVAVPGVDPRSKPVAAMLSQYTGELTPEAILTEAKEWNISAPVSQSTDATQQQQQGDQQQQQQQGGGGDLTDDEKRAHAELNKLGNGATTPEGQANGPHPIQKGLEDFHTELKGGATREEAAGAFLDSVLGAAAKGDQRVILAGGRQGPKVAAQQ